MCETFWDIERKSIWWLNFDNCTDMLLIVIKLQRLRFDLAERTQEFDEIQEH